MNRSLTLLCCLVLILQPAFSQKIKTEVNLGKTPAGISWDEWGKMNSRWQAYSTRVSVQRKDGQTVEGQLTWIGENRLLIRKNFDLPNGLMDPDDYEMVSVGDISTMKVRLGGHPYQGMIIGMLAGVIPGFVTGAILAQGWTIIPAVVFGTITAGGGGAVGNWMQKAYRKQALEINAGELTGRTLRRMKNSALFPKDIPDLPVGKSGSTLPVFEDFVKKSKTMQRAFPEKPFSVSIQSSLMTNSIRKRLQNWYMSPIWGPPGMYYETRIGLEADITRRIGNRFQAGALFSMVPGNISSSFLDKNLPEWNVYYSYNHHFSQTTFGLYGGWLLHPANRYRTKGLEASIQVGAVVSDIYEHFYFQWNAIDNVAATGETFIREHHYQPGGMLRLKTSWYLIPGFSIDGGIEGFLIRKVLFNERTVLPETTYGPMYISRHTLNFSNVQCFVGFSLHL